MEIMLDAYIDLADIDITEIQSTSKGKYIKFKDIQGSREVAFNESIEGIKSMPLPAVLTITPLLRMDNDYSNVTRIHKFESTFMISESGLSRPKIIVCWGQDGIPYKQLIKGGDDMRQDAVMQQVFEHVNQTLHRVEETRKRRLGIATYKIIPLTPQSGVIHFVENTISFGSYLTDKETGAHARYYPTDWTHDTARNYMKQATENKEKYERFLIIQKNFRPVFRFFLLENFTDVAQWVACRIAYTHSVAVTSIVGYILGIGDRHAQNILVNTLTAEVVHIDFGIVYEQGKGLQTPETVPFRLTRDIVDGFGVTGIEGTFRQSCIQTLQVLRDHASSLLTILEVIIHDPLYKWKVSPLQARKRQAENRDDGEGEAEGGRTVGIVAKTPGGGSGRATGKNATLLKAAATTTTKTTTKTCDSQDEEIRAESTFGRDAANRTIARIRNKLQGHEDPTGEPLGVEGQVEFVLCEAMSPQNLSKLFQGWSAWL